MGYLVWQSGSELDSLPSKGKGSTKIWKQYGRHMAIVGIIKVHACGPQYGRAVEEAVARNFVTCRSFRE